MPELLNQIRAVFTGREHDLPGLWERHSDAFEGCTVLVKNQDGQLAGTITQLPKRMTQCGWIIGDLKWRSIRRIGKNRYALQDLFKEIDTATQSIRSVTYLPAEIRLKKDDLVLQCDPSVPSAFPSQKWRKIGRLAETESS